MKKKRLFLVSTITLAGIAMIVYFGLPVVAEGIIKDKLQESYAVNTVSISWSGPQVIRGLQFQEGAISADLAVVVDVGLISIATGSSDIRASISGDATLRLTEPEEENEEPIVATTHQAVSASVVSVQTSEFTMPSILVKVHLDTFTIEEDQSIVYTDVLGEIDVNPGRHCSGTLQGTTDLGGDFSIRFNAPTLIDASGGLNSNAEGTIEFDVTKASLPTLGGTGGWSIEKLQGNISTPNLQDSMTVSVSGSFAQYEEPRGLLIIKTQLTESSSLNNTLAIYGRDVVGSIDFQDVPSSILAPFLNTTPIEPVRDLGETFNMQVTCQGSSDPFIIHFSSDRVNASGVVNNIEGVILDTQLTARLQPELIDALSEGVIAGSCLMTLQLDRLVPYGHGDDTLIGHIKTEGALIYVPHDISFDAIDTSIQADLIYRTVSVSGTTLIDKNVVEFGIDLQNNNKHILHTLVDLLEAINNQLPHGNGKVFVTNVPMSCAQNFINLSWLNPVRDIGPTMNVTATLSQEDIAFQLTSKKVDLKGNARFQEKTFQSLQDCTLKATVGKKLAGELLGIEFGSSVSVDANIESLDLDGNATFQGSIDIGKQHTFVQGETTSVQLGDEQQLQLHVAATGIDTHLIDKIGNCNGLLVDSIGSPIAIECVVSDLLGTPLVVAGGNSPNAAFESSFILFDSTASTVPKTVTQAELQLSPTLTRHLLKDLGPVLSDIRTVKHPIQMSVRNATTSLEGDISKLNADINIDIGEVALDSGSFTLQLLPLFKSSHVETIPAVFDPIEIQIRKGIIRYKEFNLTINGKYIIPYSGSINLVERTLDLKSAVPLTGLGYSIKELRNLATDIDVPIRITGSIDNPIVKVDPTFDLSDILQSAAVDAIGDAINDALTGGTGEAPDPLKLLEELLGGN